MKKKRSLPVVPIIAAFFVLFILFIGSWVITSPQPKGCQVITIKIIKITEGSSYDIVFHDDGTDKYYINRGLEYGLNLDNLNATVLNKTVTLHLPKLLGGLVTSEHIAQLAINDQVIYTEFKQ